jgi:phosphohistidine phosphatase
MILYLLRHGIAEEREPDKADRDRKLTTRGRARMRRGAAGLAAMVEPLDAILTSPFPRAAETAVLAAAAMPKAPKPREVDALAHGTGPLEMLRVLRGLVDGERVMLVGHEPELSSLASLLLTGSVDGARIALKKGGCLALEIRALAPRTATLAWALTPRALRRIGRAHARSTS